MKIKFVVILLSFVSTLCVPTARAGERVRAGQWETTMTVVSGKPMITKYCISAAEAASMNGDLATLRKYVEQSTAEKTKGRCTVKDVKVQDNQVTVTTACGKIETVTTTTYHGDHYESSSSGGVTTTGKRLGACP